MHLLAALEGADAPAGLKELESVQVLRQVWQQYYDLSKGPAKWRAGPQAEEQEGVVRSPYDTQARSGKKRETVWFGYKVHLTETCEPDSPETVGVPHLIVQVETTVGSAARCAGHRDDSAGTRSGGPAARGTARGYRLCRCRAAGQQSAGPWHQAAGSGLVR